MTPAITPIPTLYGGTTFRSRLEARWVVFFDSLGIEWRYEPEGFKLADGSMYLPDFFLPQFKLWAEVKPAGGFTDEVMSKVRPFVEAGMGSLLLLEDYPAGEEQPPTLLRVSGSAPCFCFLEQASGLARMADDGTQGNSLLESAAELARGFQFDHRRTASRVETMGNRKAGGTALAPPTTQSAGHAPPQQRAPDALEVYFAAAVLREKRLLLKDTYRVADELTHNGARSVVAAVACGQTPEDAVYEASDRLKQALSATTLPAESEVLELAFAEVCRKLKIRSIEQAQQRIARDTAVLIDGDVLTTELAEMLGQQTQLASLMKQLKAAT